jgi:mannitol/fructose-specific phosphotransferase system IIA component (Ntr-type)
MTLSQLTEPRLLIPRLLSDGWEGAVHEMAARLANVGRIGNAAGFVAAVLERESKVSTFVPQGLAFPHARGQAVRTLSLAVGLSRQGLPWRRDRKAIAKVVFLIAVPLGEAKPYLQVLCALARFAQDEAAFSALTRCHRPEQMLQVLERVRGSAENHAA